MRGPAGTMANPGAGRLFAMTRFLPFLLSLALWSGAAAQGPVVSLTVTDATVAEAGTNTGRMRLSRTGSTDAALTVQVRLRGTATQGADYSFDAGTIGTTILIPAGAVYRDLVITPVDDAVFDEEDEDIKLEVRAASAGQYAIGADFAAEVEIVDNDVTPEPPVLTADLASSGSEAGPVPATFRIIREGTPNVALTVFYSLTGTATAGVDYPPQAGSVSMPAGVMAVNVSVPVFDDALIEPAETLVFTILPSGIAPTDPPRPEAYEIDLQGSATATLTSNDAASIVQVVAVDAIATETGPTPAAFRIQRTGGTAASLTVHFDTAGTATAGTDYTPLGGSVALPAGAFFVDVPVTAIDDAEIEPDETITLNLLPTTASAGSLEAYSLGLTSSATANLLNNDFPPQPTVAITTPANHVAEQGKPFSVAFDAADSDGFIASYTVTGGGTSQTFSTGYSQPPAPGTLYSGTASVTFSTRYTNNVTITIRDNNGNTATATRGFYVIAAQPPPPPPPPPRPVINIETLDAEGTESPDAPDTAKFRVSHDFPTDNPVWFLAAIGGSASPTDYTLSVTPFPSFLGTWYEIPAGQSELIIEVTPIDDALIENPETVSLELYTPPFNGFTEGGPNFFEPGTFGFYYGVSPGANVVIQDNETVPASFNWVTLTASDAEASETPDNSDPAVFTVARTGATTHPLTVRYALTTPPVRYPLTFPRTVMATPGVDFQALTGTVTIPAGASAATIVIHPVFDLLAEPMESVQITLLPSLLPYQTTGSYAIEHNIVADAHIVSFTGTPALATVSVETTWRRVGRRRFIRDSSGIRDVRPFAGRLMITRSAINLSEPLSVYYQTGGSAVNGEDYEFLPGVVTIPAGARSVTMMVTTRNVIGYRPPRVSFTLTVIPPQDGPPTYLIHTKNSGALSIRDDTVASAATTALPAASSSAPSGPATPPASAPAPLLERLPDGGAVVTQETLENDTLFQVECSADMLTWQVLDIVQSEEGEVEYYDPAATAMNRCFYRLVEIPPP